MPSFKNSTAGVVASNEVTSYVPVNFDNDVSAKPVQSFAFIDSQKANAAADFQIDPQTSLSIGLTEAKTREQQKKFDAEVMRYVQKIKDDAFQEAYKKGLEQGIEEAKSSAYKEANEEMRQQIKSLIQMTEDLGDLRERMLETNEKEIIEFSYMMAEKIVFRALERDPAMILSAIKTIAVHQEDMTIRVSPADHAVIQPHLDLLATEMNLANIRFEKDAALNSGDVVVESEQGTVDGSLTTRLKKLKSLLDGQE